MVFLVFLVVLVCGAGVVRLDNGSALCSGNVVLLAAFALVTTGAVAELNVFSSLWLPQVLGAKNTLTILQIWLEWANICLVDIIDDNGSYSNNFSRASGHYSHEDKEEHGVLASGTEQFLGHKGGSQAFHYIFFRKHRRSLSGGEAKVGKPHSSSKGEGDSKPGKSATNEAPNSLKWLSSHRRLPIGLVAKYSAKITNNVNDSENKST